MGNLPTHPLFDHFFKESSFRLVSRPYDSRWSYIGAVKGFQSGFNPFLNEIYFNEISNLAFWLRGSEAPDSTGTRAKLLHEVLFLVHDYLHIWAMRLIDHFCKTRLGRGIRDRNHRELELFMILTEAVATVGLDYWVLSKTPTGRSFGLDRDIEFLTINLFPDQIEEIQKIDPQFNIHRESLYGEIVQFYLSGQLQGFTIDEVKASKALEKYVVHEISYGELQRAYARMFVQYAFEGAAPKEHDTSPMSLGEPWHQDLVEFIGRTLWTLINIGESPELNPVDIIFPRLRPEQISHPNPRLISAEKHFTLSSEEWLREEDGFTQVFLSNINLSSFSLEDQGRILEAVKKESYIPEVHGFYKKLKSYTSTQRLKQDHGSLPDFLFSIP